MSQPVKLSDGLVLDARLAGEVAERSIAGQIEFWAKLGCAIDALLTGQNVRQLNRAAAARSLEEALATVDTPEGRRRVEAVLAREPYPHFEPHPTRPELLVRIDEDGTRNPGRFINRKWAAAAPKRKLTPAAAAKFKVSQAKAERGKQSARVPA